MTQKIPDSIMYYGIEFSRFMKVDKSEISVKGSIFSLFDTNPDGQFDDKEWETFVKSAQAEEKAQRDMQNSRNNGTIRSYERRLESARQQLVGLLQKAETYNGFNKLQEFNEKHNTSSLLQVLPSGTSAPEGVEIIDIYAFGIGQDEATGDCYRQGYIDPAINDLPPEIQQEYRELLDKARSDINEWRRIVNTDAKKITEEINKYSLLLSMAEEGRITQTQTEYGENQIYQNYYTKIRSAENPFWDRLNQAEKRLGSISEEIDRTPDTQENKEKLRTLQMQLGQIETEHKQLSLASEQWFINTYGNGISGKKSTMPKPTAQTSESTDKIAEESIINKKDGSDTKIQLPQGQKEDAKKPEGSEDTESKDVLEMSASKLSEKIETEKDDESIQETKDSEEPISDENKELRERFNRRNDPEELVAEALGTPETDSEAKATGEKIAASGNAAPASGDAAKDAVIAAALSGNTSSASGEKTSSKDISSMDISSKEVSLKETDGGGSEQTTTATSSVSDSYSSKNFNSNVSAKFSFGMENIPVMPPEDKDKDSETLLDGESLETTGFEKVEAKLLEGNDSGDISKEISSDGTTSVQEPSLGQKPTSMSASVTGAAEFKDENLSGNISAEVSGNITQDNLSLSGDINTGLKYSNGKITASLSSNLHQDAGTNIKSQEEEIKAVDLSEEKGKLMDNDGNKSGTTIETGPLSSTTTASFRYDGENLDASAGATLVITSEAGKDPETDESGHIKVTSGADASLSYIKDDFSLLSNGRFQASDKTTTINGSLDIRYQGLSFSSNISSNTTKMDEAPKFDIPPEILAMMGDSFPVQQDNTETTSQNTNFKTSLGYKNGNIETSVENNLSITDGNSKNTTSLLVKYNIDRFYMQTSADFSKASSEYKIGGGAALSFQNNKNFSLSVNPGIDAGYSTGDSAFTLSPQLSASLSYTKDDTQLSMTLSDSFSGRFYTDGSEPYFNNMLMLGGNLSIGQFSGNLNMAYMTSQGSVTSSVPGLDFSADNKEASSSQTLTVGGGIGYHTGNTDLSLNVSDTLGDSQFQPTLSASVTINLGRPGKKPKH